MDSLRKTALVAGLLYVITFVSIPTLVLYGPVLSDPNYIVGPGPDTPVIIGAILEVIVALAGVGTAVVLYPVVKRQNEAAALGFVGSRTLEGAAIVAGVVSLLSLVTLRQAGAGAGALATGQALAASYNWFFLLGQSLMPVVNALLLGSLLYRSRLVPRILPLVGLIGAPILLASDIAVHREQLADGLFFHPHDAQGLAALIRLYRDAPPPFSPVDYAAARQDFAEALGGMIERAAAAFVDYPRLLMRSPRPPLTGAP